MWAEASIESLVYKIEVGLLSWGFHSSVLNTSLFVKNTKYDIIYLLVYIDDILVIGSCSTLVQQSLNFLEGTFALKLLGLVSCFINFEAH